jgi:hypothetical protein
MTEHKAEIALCAYVHRPLEPIAGYQRPGFPSRHTQACGQIDGDEIEIFREVPGRDSGCGHARSRSGAAMQRDQRAVESLGEERGFGEVSRMTGGRDNDRVHARTGEHRAGWRQQTLVGPVVMNLRLCVLHRRYLDHRHRRRARNCPGSPMSTSCSSSGTRLCCAPECHILVGHEQQVKDSTSRTHQVS